MGLSREPRTSGLLLPASNSCRGAIALTRRRGDSQLSQPAS
jgi:hypothetical protein